MDTTVNTTLSKIPTSPTLRGQVITAMFRPLVCIVSILYYFVVTIRHSMSLQFSRRFLSDSCPKFLLHYRPLKWDWCSRCSRVSPVSKGMASCWRRWRVGVDLGATGAGGVFAVRRFFEMVLKKGVPIHLCLWQFHSFCFNYIVWY